MSDRLVPPRRRRPLGAIGPSVGAAGDLGMVRRPPGVATTPMEVQRQWQSPGVGDPRIGSFRKGGKVKKTGTYKLHKGEKVTKAKTAAKPKARKR